MGSLDGIVTFETSAYRPCYVNETKALFHRWVQRDKPIINLDVNIRLTAKTRDAVLKAFDDYGLAPINDDDSDVPVALDMGYSYIIEMICDWWSFSWKTGNLYEIFSWYDSHKERMILHKKTKKTVETILVQIYTKLEELKKGENENVNN